jgi:hypothetical protein
LRSVMPYLGHVPDFMPLPPLKTLKWVVSEDEHVKGKRGIQDLSLRGSELLKNLGMEVGVTIEIRPWDLAHGRLLSPENLDEWLDEDDVYI